MYAKLLPFVTCLVSLCTGFQIRVDLDSSAIAFPNWITGTFEVTNTDSATLVLNIEESLPEFSFSRDTGTKLQSVTDFGPRSPVKLQSGVSAIWSFMAALPIDYAKKLRSGNRKAALRAKIFGKVIESREFTITKAGKISEVDLRMSQMDLTRVLQGEELEAFNAEAKPIIFSRGKKGNADPRVVFWKYKLRNAGNMRDLRQMPFCENCFQGSNSFYWNYLREDWCNQFSWTKTTECRENWMRQRAKLISRIGTLRKAPPENADRFVVVETENGKYILGKSQVAMLSGGGNEK